MKINKLLATTALVFTLGVGVTACGPTEPPVSPSPSVPAVTQVKVSGTPTTVVIGQEYDLDEYVEVKGGPGPKIYDVTVPAASEGKVEVIGHKFIALERGDFTINVSAGGKTGKFSSTAVTQLEHDFGSTVENLGTEWAAYEVAYAQDGSIESVDLSIVHRDDYLWVSQYAQLADKSIVPGGMLKAVNGNTYEYYLDSTGEVVVDPAIQSDFGMYFINMPFCLSANVLEYVSETDELTGDTYEYLYLDSTIPATGYEQYFVSLIEYFMTQLGLSLIDGYYFSELYVSPTTLINEDETEYETFMFDAMVALAENNQTVGSFSYILETRSEVTEITPVREYIDEGNFPEPLVADPALDKLISIATATSYTSQTRAGWIDGQGQATACPAMLVEKGWDKAFANGVELTLADATGVQYQYQGTYNGVTTGTSTAVLGYASTTEGVYEYTNETVVEDSPAIGTEFTTTLVPEIASLDLVLNSLTLKSLAGLDKTTVKVLSVVEQESYTLYSVESHAILQSVLLSTYFGQGIYSFCTNGYGVEDLSEVLGLNLILFTNGSLLVDISLVWTRTEIYSFQVQYGNIGSTTITHPGYVAPTPGE